MGEQTKVIGLRVTHETINGTAQYRRGTLLSVLRDTWHSVLSHGASS